MTDVVGLRFVTEGEQQALRALEAYRRGLIGVGDIQEKHVVKINAAIQSELRTLEHAQKLRQRVHDEDMKRLATMVQMQERSSRQQEQTFMQEMRAFQVAQKLKQREAEATAAAQQRIAAEAQAWTAALNERLGVTGQRATELGATFTRLAEVQQRLAESARQWAAQLNERLGVTGQRATQAGASFEALDAKMRGAAQSYEQLRASMDPVVAAQQRYAEAERRVTEAVRLGIATREQGNTTLAAYRMRLTDLNRTALDADTIAGRLRNQFLATANSIAILDGPLGGIASRFSAFGVLIGRTGLLIGGALVSVAALGAVLNRGTRALVEWEAANARVNAILQTTGYQAGLTGEQIRHMTSQIALGTLETEQSVMQAAQRLLTFRDIAGDVFESVLRAAADMAALGFGTIESEAVKLAKALEDPAQALTSLSRAGIVFTRQQRQVIISLVESGRQAEAMERILSNVNARVGGAAEAAARDTLAGAFDTIGQAAGRAVREIAGTVLQVTGLDAAIRALASSVADFAGGPTPLDRQVAESRARLAQLRSDMVEAQRLLDDDPFVRAFGTAALGRGQRLPQGVQADIDAESRKLEVLEAQLRAQERLAAFARQSQMVRRDSQALDDLTTEVGLRRELIGLSEDEQRLQRTLAQLGLRNLDIDQRVQAHRDGLAAAGVEMRRIDASAETYRITLGRIAEVTARAMQTAEMERQARAFQSALTNLEQQNVLLDQQHYFMQQGLSAADARQRAEETLLITQSTILAQMDPTNSKLQEMADRIALAVGYSRDLKAQMDAIADAERRRAEIRDFIQNLEDEVQLLNIQLGLLRQGVSFTESQRRATIALHQARIAQLVTEGAITKELGKQLSMRLAQLAAEGETLQVDIEAFRPARGGGGGGAAQQVVTLQALQDELLREQAIRRELLGLMGEELRVREVYYDLVRRLGDEAVNYTEAQIMGTARLISEQMALNEAVERQRQLQEQVANTLTNLFMAATQGAESFKQALSGVLRQLAQVLANRAFMQIMGRFGLGFMAPLPKAANGMAFSGGNIIPFAKGGVVDSPTLFPMSHGRTGLMGEAGPEAVVPLRRGKDGKLGIGAEPQRVAVDVRVHMDENGNWKTNVARIADSRVSRAAPRIISQSVGATYAAASERKMR
jgi:hypothetical protein